MAAGGTFPPPLLGVGALPRCRTAAHAEWPDWALHADAAEAFWLWWRAARSGDGTALLARPLTRAGYLAGRLWLGFPAYGDSALQSLTQLGHATLHKLPEG